MTLCKHLLSIHASLSLRELLYVRQRYPDALGNETRRIRSTLRETDRWGEISTLLA